jgi:hypothetical protein
MVHRWWAANYKFNAALGELHTEGTFAKGYHDLLAKDGSGNFYRFFQGRVTFTGAVSEIGS